MRCLDSCYTCNTMATPTWQYLAGFFDGEGCIEWRSSFVLVVTQSDRADNVLAHIAIFLRSRDVRCILRARRLYKRKDPVRWRPQSQIEVLDWRSVRRCLRKMLPFLIVKRERALKALEYIQNRKWKPSLIPEERVGRAYLAYRDGLSFRQIEARFHLSSKILRLYMKRQGYASRTRTMAIRKWHNEMQPRKKAALRAALRRGSRRRFKQKS
jgi:hypothetical protein